MAGIFQQQLQTQVQPTQAVADNSASAAIDTLTDVAAGFFRSQKANKPAGPTYKQAKLENFSADLNRIQALAESGEIPDSRIKADARIAAQRVASLDVPEAIKQQYEAVTGDQFDAFAYEDPEEYQTNQLLRTEFAQGIRPSVAAELEAQGVAVTPEAIDAGVLSKVEQKNLLDNQVEIQRQKRILGQPVETTPIFESIQSDYRTLLDAVKSAQADTIVEQAEFRSLQMSVSNLITTKYAGFETNPEINGVIKQMNGLLSDVGKGVSSTPSAVLADTLQVALQSKGFNPVTIAIARAQLEQNPESFKANFAKNDEGETVADALVSLLEGGAQDKPIVDIFDSKVAPVRTPVAGENPSLMQIPSVSEKPEAYKQVVDKLSSSATTTDPNRILGSQEVRNSWLNSMNIVGSAVASQSDEFILGEKLIAMFASNGVVKNLDAVYRTDPANAAQTNDVLQKGLSAERVRQVNELNNRLNAGVGEGQLVLVSQDGRLQLNNELIDKNAASLAGGVAGWNEMRSKIDAAGGLEAFLKLPKTGVRGPNLDAAVMVNGTPYFLSDMFRIEFDKVSKLTNNLKMIDTKLGNLETLATKYQEDTDMLRGKRQDTADAVGATTGSVTAQLIDQYEAGRGGYRTLFGQAQEAGKPFEGFDVTTKTLGELYEFSNPSGAAGTYGAYVKENNPEGDLATPMGRYQFVGKTLRQVAKDMNLPDSTVFTPEVQDSMFLFKARQVTNGKSQKGKRDALRGTWTGFKSASDAQLDQMIGEIESGNPNLGAGAFASTNARMTPEVTVTPLADRGPEVQASAPVASMAPAGGAVGATGIPAEATLDPTITQDTPENQVGDAPSAPTDQAAALGQAEGLSTEVQGFLANLDEDIPADKVQALLDYFGIDVNEQFGNREEIIDRAMAKALSMGGTDEGKFSKAEALQYFLDKLQG